MGAATPARADNVVSGTVTPAEAWPICSTMGSMVETADWAALDPDFAAGKRAIVARDWTGAINALMSAGLRDARNADISKLSWLRLSPAAAGRSGDATLPAGADAQSSAPKRANTSVKPTCCKAISPKPKSISRHWSEFASFPATNMMI
jgi:hypothetical protein